MVDSSKEVRPTSGLPPLQVCTSLSIFHDDQVDPPHASTINSVFYRRSNQVYGQASGSNPVSSKRFPLTGTFSREASIGGPTKREGLITACNRTRVHNRQNEWLNSNA